MRRGSFASLLQTGHRHTGISSVVIPSRCPGFAYFAASFALATMVAGVA